MKESTLETEREVFPLSPGNLRVRVRVRVGVRVGVEVRVEVRVRVTIRVRVRVRVRLGLKLGLGLDLLNPRLGLDLLRSTRFSRNGERDLLRGHVGLGVGIQLGTWVRDKNRVRVRVRLRDRVRAGVRACSGVTRHAEGHWTSRHRLACASPVGGAEPVGLELGVRVGLAVGARVRMRVLAGGLGWCRV